jgi:hypothetical protein
MPCTPCNAIHEQTVPKATSFSYHCLKLPALENAVVCPPFFEGVSVWGTFDARINDLIEVSAVDRYTAIAPGRYRILYKQMAARS